MSLSPEFLCFCSQLAVCVLFVRVLVEPWRRPSSSTIWLSFPKNMHVDEAIKLIQAVSALAAEFNGGLPEVLELANAVKGFSAQAPVIKNGGGGKKRRPATATTGQGQIFSPRHRLDPLRR